MLLGLFLKIPSSEDIQVLQLLKKLVEVPKHQTLP